MRVFPDLTVDGEFKALGDTGVSGSLNDRQFTYLGNSGYTGALPDRFGEYSGFTPASLFSGASSRGFMFDFRDYNTLFTDTAGTTRVTSTNQSVARVNDKSGLGNHATQGTLGNRPLSVIFPSSGVRNRANGSADGGNAAFWPAAPVQNGITATKIASGFDTDGLPYVDVRYQGTATGTSHDAAYNGTANARVGGSVGQQFTENALVTRIGGSLTGVNGFRLTVVEETAPTTYIGQTFSSFATSTSETLISTSLTLATGNQARAAVHMSFTSGATIDVTYRIKALQFEIGPTRTNYQFNYSAQNVTEPGFASIRGIQFDGVDDWLQTAAIDFSNSDEVTVVAGVRKLSDAARATLFVQQSGGAQRISIEAPGTGLNNYTAVSGGTINIAVSAVAAAPDTSIVSMQAKIATPSLILRRDGVQVASSVISQGTGNFSNQPFFIGQNNVGTQSFNGVITCLFAINRLLTASELAAVEAYANGRTGAF